MPDLPTRLAHFWAQWYQRNLKPVLVKAPRKRPDLVFVVAILAVAVVALYAYAVLHGA